MRHDARGRGGRRRAVKGGSDCCFTPRTLFALLATFWTQSLAVLTLPQLPGAWRDKSAAPTAGPPDPETRV